MSHKSLTEFVKISANNFSESKILIWPKLWIDPEEVGVDQPSHALRTKISKILRKLRVKNIYFSKNFLIDKWYLINFLNCVLLNKVDYYFRCSLDWQKKRNESKLLGALSIALVAQPKNDVFSRNWEFSQENLNPCTFPGLTKC